MAQTGLPVPALDVGRHPVRSALRAAWRSGKDGRYGTTLSGSRMPRATAEDTAGSGSACHPSRYPHEGAACAPPTGANGWSPVLRASSPARPGRRAYGVSRRVFREFVNTRAWLTLSGTDIVVRHQKRKLSPSAAARRKLFRPRLASLRKRRQGRSRIARPRPDQSWPPRPLFPRAGRRAPITAARPRNTNQEWSGFRYRPTPPSKSGWRMGRLRRPTHDPFRIWQHPRSDVSVLSKVATLNGQSSCVLRSDDTDARWRLRPCYPEITSRRRPTWLHAVR
jgi:hypothetical protein